MVLHFQIVDLVRKPTKKEIIVSNSVQTKIHVFLNRRYFNLLKSPSIETKSGNRNNILVLSQKYHLNIDNNSSISVGVSCLGSISTMLNAVCMKL